MKERTLSLHLNSVPGPAGVETFWIDLTPELAQRLLAEHNTGNRFVSVRHTKVMAKDITESRWTSTHQGLAFDVEGTMLDGQHRCAAVIQSGQPIKTMVTTGLPTEARRHLDLGRKRAAGDFLDGSYRTIRAGAGRVLVALEMNAGHRTSYADFHSDWKEVNTTMVTEYLNDEEISEILVKHVGAVKMGNAHNTLSPSAVLGVAAWYDKSGVTDSWLEGLVTGAGLENGDPRLSLRNYRANITATAGGGQVPRSVWLCLRSIQAFINGERIDRMQFAPGSRLLIPTRG
jgi:hypothetical protein